MTSTPQYVLIYARASSDPKDLKVSVDHQIVRGERYTAEHWPTAKVLVFRDDDLSAAKPGVVRKGFNDFRQAVLTLPKGSIVGIVVNEQSRLTRLGERSWEEIIGLLTVAGVATVHSLKEGQISVQEGSQLVGNLLASIHQDTAARIAADVRNTHAELFREGRPSGRAPFGFVSVKDEDGRPALKHDPAEARAVRQMFKWVREGYAIATIADRLNAGKVPPRAARFKFKDGRKITKWTANSVKAVLTSPTVGGLRAHTDADGVMHTVPAKWDWIIDERTWDEVQRILGRPTMVKNENGDTYRVRTKPAPQPRKYLLSGGRRRSGIKGEQGDVYGVLRCGKCQHPLVAQTQSRPGGVRVPAYQCHPKLGAGACGGISISPAGEVEAHVVQTIQDELADSPRLRKLLDVTKDAEADRWRAERKAAKARMLDASQLLGSGTIDRDSFDVMHNAAKAAYEAADGHLASMVSDTTLPSVDDVINRWETLTLRQQRAVVERLIERIDVMPGSTGRPGFNADRLGVPIWRA
jgi:DNA invertase Pin-like site-specific DNA recombinase